MKVPLFIQQLFGSVVWKIQVPEPTLFLTFDDGPNPEVTLPVLDILKSYQAKATFFCVGENISRHADVFEKVLSEGHAVGNHTFHHLNGWKTGTKKYLSDVRQCEMALEDAVGNNEKPKIFRPPYGKLNPSQFAELKSHYSIVMWDVLSADYDKRISKEKCFTNVTSHAQNGSIVVFHDSLKAKNHLMYALPKVLDHFTKQNFSFRSITNDILDKQL